MATVFELEPRQPRAQYVPADDHARVRVVVDGDTVYYGDDETVGGESNQGKIGGGESKVFRTGHWLRSAGVSKVTVYDE